MKYFTSKIAKWIAVCAVACLILSKLLTHDSVIQADTSPLAMLDPNLQVTPVLTTGINQPIGIVFLGLNDYLVLEKASG